MTLRLETLAACAANLMALAREYSEIPELKLGLSLTLEELRKEIRSVEKKRAAA